MEEKVNMAENKKSRSQPATKDDLQIAKTGLQNEIQAVKTELQNEIQAVKTELKSDIKRLEDIVGTNTIDILRIKDDIRDIRETMATKDDINRILGAIDAFAGEARDHRRKDLERGHMMMKHEDKLEDHESRITLLETGK